MIQCALITKLTFHRRPPEREHEAIDYSHHFVLAFDFLDGEQNYVSQVYLKVSDLYTGVFWHEFCSFRRR